MEIRWIEWDRDWRQFLKLAHESPAIPDFVPPKVPVIPPGECAKYEQARLDVGEDSDAAEFRDQATIRRWEIRCYGVSGPLTARWDGDWFGKSFVVTEVSE